VLVLVFGWSSADLTLARVNNKSLPQSSKKGSKAPGKWLTAMPSTAGFNPDTLDTAIDRIGLMKGVYSALVVRNGYLVVERYFREGYRAKPHNLKSASKSVLSALIGIAIDKGKLHLDQPICELLPQCKNLNDPRKADITIRHLMTMTSGLSTTSSEHYNQWVNNGDWVKASLDQPLVADPGTHYQYSTADTHILSAVLTSATGISTREYALRYLFGPMNITVKGWSKDPKGIYQGGNNLALIPLDMAKIGQLYLDGGKYGGRQIVPQWWVDVSTRAGHLGYNEIYGNYGFLWYSRPNSKDAFVAVGYGGQYIYVSPLYDCVIVITSTLDSKGRKWEKKLFDLIHEGIIGSIRIDKKELLMAAGVESVSVTAIERHTAAEIRGTGRTVVRLNLRQGPNKSDSVITTLAAGTVLEIKEQKGTWIRVRAGSLNGWVFAQYVRTVSDAVTTVDRRKKKVPPKKKPANVQDTKPVTVGSAVHDLKKLQAEVENIRSSLLASEHARKQTDRVLHTIKKELNTQRDTTARLEADRKSLVSELAEVRSRKTTHLDFLKAALAEREKSKVELDELRKELAAQRKAAEQFQSARKAVEAELMSTRNEVAKISSAIDTAQSDREYAKSALTPLHHKLKEQQKTIDTSKEAQNKITQDLSAVHAQIKLLEKTITDQQDDRRRLTSEIARLDKELNTQRDTAARSKADRTPLVSELAEVRYQNTALMDTLKAEQAEREERKAELDELRKELAVQRKAAEQFQSAQKAVEAELVSARNEVAKISSAIDTAQSDREYAKSALTPLHNQLKEQQKTITTSEEAQNKITQDLSAVHAQIKLLEKTITASWQRSAARTPLCWKRLKQYRQAGRNAKANWMNCVRSWLHSVRLLSSFNQRKKLLKLNSCLLVMKWQK
jgi:CubicO group peptidase (beta-lactamase class C family)/septal ring factor EnvC (AmiA/AmiB activator)